MEVVLQTEFVVLGMFYFVIHEFKYNNKTRYFTQQVTLYFPKHVDVVSTENILFVWEKFYICIPPEETLHTSLDCFDYPIRKDISGMYLQGKTVEEAVDKLFEKDMQSFLILYQKIYVPKTWLKELKKLSER
jgi:hypothetical protein